MDWISLTILFVIGLPMLFRIKGINSEKYSRYFHVVFALISLIIFFYFLFLGGAKIILLDLFFLFCFFFNFYYVIFPKEATFIFPNQNRSKLTYLMSSIGCLIFVLVSIFLIMTGTIDLTVILGGVFSGLGFIGLFYKWRTTN